MEETENDLVTELQTTISDEDLKSEKEKYDEMVRNLQNTLGISKEELEGTMAGEHFNHQY